MKIGINASFLRKPGTGIGEVTHNLLTTLGKRIEKDESRPVRKFVLYVEEELKPDVSVPAQFHVRVVTPWWKRDDLVCKVLWEWLQLPLTAKRDGCDAFISLYQCPTEFRGPESEDGDTAEGEGTRIPVSHVMIVHDLIPRMFPEYLGNWRKRLYWRMTERAISAAPSIVAVSDSTKRDLIGLLGVAESRIAVAHPALSPAFARAVPDDEVDRTLSKYGLTRDGYIYHGGGLEVRKNAEALLRAYRDLASVPSPSGEAKTLPPLVISGTIHPESNPLATPIRKLVDELGLEGAVKLLGFVPGEDLPALYRGARLFVYPSRYEGFGLPVLEAMSQGTPVLASRVSSIPEVGGDAIAYFDPDDVGSIAGGIGGLLADEGRRRELSRMGREWAGTFSYDRLVDAILQAL